MSAESIENRKKIKTLRKVRTCRNCNFLSPYTHYCWRRNESGEDIQAWVDDDEVCDAHRFK